MVEQLLGVIALLLFLVVFFAVCLVVVLRAGWRWYQLYRQAVSRGAKLAENYQRLAGKLDE